MKSKLSRMSLQDFLLKVISKGSCTLEELEEKIEKKIEQKSSEDGLRGTIGLRQYESTEGQIQVIVENLLELGVLEEDSESRKISLSQDYLENKEVVMRSGIYKRSGGEKGPENSQKRGRGGRSDLTPAERAKRHFEGVDKRLIQGIGLLKNTLRRQKSELSEEQVEKISAILKKSAQDIKAII